MKQITQIASYPNYGINSQNKGPLCTYEQHHQHRPKISLLGPCAQGQGRHVRGREGLSDSSLGFTLLRGQHLKSFLTQWLYLSIPFGSPKGYILPRLFEPPLHFPEHPGVRL